jgi:hypothetical protein
MVSEQQIALMLIPDSKTTFDPLLGQKMCHSLATDLDYVTAGMKRHREKIFEL